MKIITDITFFNKKLQNLSANDISNIITSICNEMLVLYQVYNPVSN